MRKSRPRPIAGSVISAVITESAVRGSRESASFRIATALATLPWPATGTGTGAAGICGAVRSNSARHLRDERGLSPHTIHNRCWHVQAFLNWLSEQGGEPCRTAPRTGRRLSRAEARTGLVPGLDGQWGECPAQLLPLRR
ncbi:MAG: hypothetical protein MZV63_55890 [Marinilabiliales bacterium]|nr:hypothetical protein [Marinilabiliales bacterium]